MRSIKVSDGLYLKIERASKDFGFDSIEEFLSFIVDKISGSLNPKEEKKAKEQLKKLGYL